MAELVGQIPARSLSEWHEDHGPVLWWHFPIQEPPYVGALVAFWWLTVQAVFAHMRNR